MGIRPDLLSLTVADCHIRIQCADPTLLNLLAQIYGHLQGAPKTPDLVYTVGRHTHGGVTVFSITRAGEVPLTASTEGEFLFLFEKDMTIELQKLRRDLFFIHSAVLSAGGAAFMLVGASGSGKSTTAWALLHHGFQYLSDELAPVDLQTLNVYPYLHALCLKNKPPSEYPLPTTTLYTSRTMHISVEDLPTAACTCPTPLMAIFFACYRPGFAAPTARPLSSAEGATRLFANSLNPLAHEGDGLDESIQIAQRTPCLELFTADLPATCALVKTTIERLRPSLPN